LGDITEHSALRGLKQAHVGLAVLADLDRQSPCVREPLYMWYWLVIFRVPYLRLPRRPSLRERWRAGAVGLVVVRPAAAVMQYVIYSSMKIYYSSMNKDLRT
jgi:hypothetical protein